MENINKRIIGGEQESIANGACQPLDDNRKGLDESPFERKGVFFDFDEYGNTVVRIRDES